MGNGGVVVKCPDLAEFGRFYEIRRKQAWKAFQWGPVPPPSPQVGGAWHPPGPDQPICGLEWGGELINTVHWWGAPWGVFLTRIRFYPNYYAFPLKSFQIVYHGEYHNKMILRKFRNGVAN
jgi:hypothetical protein